MLFAWSVVVSCLSRRDLNQLGGVEYIYENDKPYIMSYYNQILSSKAKRIYDMRFRETGKYCATHFYKMLVRLFSQRIILNTF